MYDSPLFPAYLGVIGFSSNNLLGTLVGSVKCIYHTPISWATQCKWTFVTHISFIDFSISDFSIRLSHATSMLTSKFGSPYKTTAKWSCTPFLLNHQHLASSRPMYVSSALKTLFVRHRQGWTLRWVSIPGPPSMVYSHIVFYSPQCTFLDGWSSSVALRDVVGEGWDWVYPAHPETRRDWSIQTRRLEVSLQPALQSLRRQWHSGGDRYSANCHGCPWSFLRVRVNWPAPDPWWVVVDMAIYILMLSIIVGPSNVLGHHCKTLQDLEDPLSPKCHKVGQSFNSLDVTNCSPGLQERKMSRT